MTRFRWITSLAVVAVLTAATCVFAQGPGRRGGGPGGDVGPGGSFRGGARAFGFAARNLDLSDAQRQQIRAIVEKAQTDNRPLLERFRQATEARRKAMAVTPVDENQIRSTTQALAAAEADLAVARAHVQGDIFAILTPEQQAKVNEARTQRENRVAERRNRAQERRQQRQQQRQN